MTRVGRGLLVAVFGLLLVPACGSDRRSGNGIAEEEIPVEDVGEALEIDTSADRREVAPAERLAGVLPEDFPRELPLHLPASLVELEEGRAATFLTSDRLVVVRDGLLRRLRSGGWAVDETADGWTVHRGGRSARLRLEDARPGTRYRWAW